MFVGTYYLHSTYFFIKIQALISRLQTVFYTNHVYLSFFLFQKRTGNRSHVINGSSNGTRTASAEISRPEISPTSSVTTGTTRSVIERSRLDTIQYFFGLVWHETSVAKPDPFWGVEPDFGPKFGLSRVRLAF